MQILTNFVQSAWVKRVRIFRKINKKLHMYSLHPGCNDEKNTIEFYTGTVFFHFICVVVVCDSPFFAVGCLVCFVSQVFIYVTN